MAGSLGHLVTDDGGFSFALIENLGDAHEACEECYDIIAVLVDGDLERLREACRRAGEAAGQRPYGSPDVAPVPGKRSEFEDD
jgi:DNA-binding FadR family transcriptional regulator